jgi:hypothetical protein
MGLREAISNPAGGISIAAIILIVAGSVLYVNREKPLKDVRNRTQLWYYDLNTQERFPIDYHDTVEVPPQTAPSGPLKADNDVLKAGAPAGVRLYRFACDSCKNEQFDGYLKTFTTEAQKKWIEEKVSYDTIQDQVLIRRLTDDKWIPEQSDEAKKILMEPVNRCREKNQRPRECEVND